MPRRPLDHSCFSDGGCRHLTFLGATITVLMLLFDPFLQQVVVYPDRLVPSEKASTIVRAQRYQAYSDEGLPLPSIVDMSMKVGIYEDSDSKICADPFVRLPFTVAFLTFGIGLM